MSFKNDIGKFVSIFFKKGKLFFSELNVGSMLYFLKIVNVF